ncbi:unnamed protein product [Acidithrix sp. C25]|nr:unnamed protein product [Acidithrix sp. C25]
MKLGSKFEDFSSEFLSGCSKNFSQTSILQTAIDDDQMGYVYGGLY